MKPYSKVEFEKNIIKFIQQYNSPLPYLEDYLGFNYENYINDIVNHKETIDKIGDLEPHKKLALLNYMQFRKNDFLISTEEYIRSSMYYAKNAQLWLKISSKDEVKLIDLYSKLYDFKFILINNYLKKNNNGELIAPQDKDFKFNNTDFSYLEGLINELKQFDPILKNVFNFMQTGCTSSNCTSSNQLRHFSLNP